MKNTSQSRRNGRLKFVEGVVFDLDGTLVLSDRSLSNYQLLPGAAELLNNLNDRGVPFVVFTNGTNYPSSEQAPKLRALGLPISDDALLTPSSVAADLMFHRGIKRVLVLGTPGVGHALAQMEIRTIFPRDHCTEHVDAVYIGWYPECSMKDIEAAAKAIWSGAELYVASDVPFFATAGGKSMGYSYAISAAVRRVTRAPMVLTGKPSLHALRFVANRLGIPMSRVGVVGDDPLVEMIMARRGRAVGFGVTTGITNASDWAKQPAGRRPHRVLSRLGDLLGTPGIGNR